jgi:predicted ArsR family transcriptional regulator
MLIYIGINKFVTKITLMHKLTARQKVLAYLKKERTASAAQIGRALQMEPAAVRHHLSILRDDGRVEAAHEAPAGGRGRPPRFYKLTPGARGENLANVLKAVLDETPRRETFLHGVGARLAGKPAASASLNRRLAETIGRLNQMHYEARWEAAAEGPRVLFANCPYAAIIEEHPELCRMDAGLLNAELGLPARQVAKIERGGPLHCVFVMGDRAAKSSEAAG